MLLHEADREAAGTKRNPSSSNGDYRSIILTLSWFLFHSIKYCFCSVYIDLEDLGFSKIDKKTGLKITHAT